MKIHFKIPYYTVWGQRLLISGNLPELGNGDLTKALALQYHAPDEWCAEIEIADSDLVEFNYKYILLTEQTGQYTEEWGDGRALSLDAAKLDHYFCVDHWNSPSSIANVFMSTPFQEVFLASNYTKIVDTKTIKPTHLFRVKAPLLKKNEVPCLIGDVEALGSWSTQNPIIMQRSSNGYWTAQVDLKKVPHEVHYKYAIYDLEDKRFLYFESGSDRIAPIFNSKKTLIQITDDFVRMANNTWKGAGVSLPVFSIRTKQNMGVGDFADLKLFIDWAEKVGLKLIQVLPLNDTLGTHTELDVLPYAAISAFALNPLFLNLPAMGKLPESHPLQLEYIYNQTNWNAEELVPFLDVVNYKVKYAKELCLLQKDKFLKNKDFKAFFVQNAYWLEPYAAYCVLRDKFGTCDYRNWDDYAIYEAQKISEFSSPEQAHYDEILTNYFIQYHLHLQLSDAADYAHAHGVVLKGDIPIGVNRNSVDTWVSPTLFHMHMQAGAPPDMFAVKGQNWELPTYNWEEIERTGFDWWKKRFSQMSNYFDTFRIDHILGFFRIWQIPEQQIEGIMGHLYPSTPIYINEFIEKGLWMDYNRFCKPYITDSILINFFGEEAAWVKANCLQIEDGWIFRLKPSYQSQTYVENLFREGKISERVKWGLFDLISNVLFFEVEGSNGTQFYPRFGMESLPSFAELDNYSKERLRELYVHYFYRRQDAAWYKSGMDKLPALKRATNMMICGEDLGMMTPCVTSVMNELGILSLEVQRAPKSNTDEFFHPSNAPYLSVVTPSTHDMSTVRGWWEEDRNVTQRFYNSQLGHWGEAPYFCDWWICRDVVLQHLYSPAMWAIFQLQDLLGMSDAIRRVNPHDERINVPSNSLYSWRYRLHINIEELLQKDEFNAELKNYISQSGRL